MAETVKLRKFRLKEGCGPHWEPNPEFNKDVPPDEDNKPEIECKPGKPFKSLRPLDKLFVNKFEVIDGGDRKDVQSAGGDVPGENDPDEGRPVRSVEDARVNRADRHATEEELEGKPELQKLSKGAKLNAPKKEDKEESEDVEEETEDEGYGKDVTSDFEGAEEGGLLVKKDSAGTYRVFEEGEDDPMEGAKRGFTLKKEVKNFIKKQTSSE